MMEITAFKALTLLWVLGFVNAAGYILVGGGNSGGFGALNGLYGGAYGGQTGYGSGSSSVLLVPVTSGNAIGGISSGFGGGSGGFGLGTGFGGVAGFEAGFGFGGILRFIFPLIILIIILSLTKNTISSTG